MGKGKGAMMMGIGMGMGGIMVVLLEAEAEKEEALCRFPSAESAILGKVVMTATTEDNRDAHAPLLQPNERKFCNLWVSLSCKRRPRTCLIMSSRRSSKSNRGSWGSEVEWAEGA